MGSNETWRVMKWIKFGSNKIDRFILLPIKFDYFYCYQTWYILLLPKFINFIATNQILLLLNFQKYFLWLSWFSKQRNPFQTMHIPKARRTKVNLVDQSKFMIRITNQKSLIECGDFTLEQGAINHSLVAPCYTI